jgi:hypothetical protein
MSAEPIKPGRNQIIVLERTDYCLVLSGSYTPPQTGREDISDEQPGLHGSQFVNPNACDKWIGLGQFLRLINTLRLDDVVTGNAIHIPW